MPRFILMEVKQESDVFNYEQKFKMEEHFLFDKKSKENENSFKYMDTQLPVIKQENNNIEEYPGYFQQTDIKPNSNFNQNIDGDNLKGNLVQLSFKEQSRKANYTGKNYTKHWVLPGGILICMFCGNMFTKPLELFYHIVQHLVKKIRYTGQASNHKDMNCELKSEHGQTNNTPAIIPIKKEHTEENIFKCKFCSKSFSIYSRILKHMHTHAKEKPFKCEICSKSFPIISKLVRHMFTHAEEKPFKCEICPKSYTSNYSLVEHMYSHTNNYPFNCEVCSNSFGRKSRLVNHMRKHTGEKPFQCEVCSKSLAIKYNLVCHMQTHTSEKPFKCEICSKPYTKKMYLVQHMHKHTGEKPFKFEVCSTSSVENNKLVKHMLR